MAITGTADEKAHRIGGLVLLHGLAKRWWLVLLRGIAAILFGLIALFSPGLTLLTLVFLWGLYAIADGVFSLWAAISGHVSEMTPRWWLAVVGVVGIAAGIMAMAWPGATAIAILLLIASWAIIIGVMQILGAIRLRKEIDNEWMLGLAGLLSVALGVFLFAQPGAGALAMVWWIGILAIATGAVYIGLALKLRKHAHLKAKT
jgi:uncharacterized membrane protein HdeD (DUF308 family)